MNKKNACKAIGVNEDYFNPKYQLPYGLKTKHIYGAMNEFVEFLGFINVQLNTKSMARLESFLMPANFRTREHKNRAHPTGLAL